MLESIGFSGSNSLNWTYLYDADGFLQFRVLIRVLELISVPNQSRDSFILIQIQHFDPYGSEIVTGSTLSVTGVIHLIGHNFMMPMDSFNLWVLIRFLELISVPKES